MRLKKIFTLAIITVAASFLTACTCLPAAPVVIQSTYSGAPAIASAPNYYEQITIKPVATYLVLAMPIVVQPVFGSNPAPIYLHLSPLGIQNWGFYCHQYNACSTPVYFVQDAWYEGYYAPLYGGRYLHDGHSAHGKRQ